MEERTSKVEFIASLERLFYLAFEDTGGSRYAANFLLAWWNGEAFGGFNFKDIWGLDGNHKLEVMRVIDYMRRGACYFDEFGFRPHIDKVIRIWRPENFDPEVIKQLEESARMVPAQPIHQSPITTE